MPARSIVTLAIGLFVALHATDAFAQSDQERAVELAQEAGAAFQEGRFEDAAKRYSEAHEYYPDLSLKMNEMISWYKAEACTQALDSAGQILASGSSLSDADSKDVGKVNLECGYLAAVTMFDEGNLDGAEARLNLVKTDDVETAQKIGILRGKIEERRRTDVVDASAANDIENENPDDAKSPPGWMGTTGVVLAGIGAAGGAFLIVKWFAIDSPQLIRHAEEFESVHECTLTPKRSEDLKFPLCGDVPSVRETAGFKDYLRKRKAVNTAQLVGGIASGVVFGAGAVLYVLHATSSGTSTDASVEAAYRPMLLPIIDRSNVGAVLRVPF